MEYNDLQWQSLQSRRATLKVTMLYKIIHNLVSIPSHYLIPNTSNTRHHNFTYRLPYSRIIVTCTHFSHLQLDFGTNWTTNQWINHLYNNLRLYYIIMHCNCKHTPRLICTCTHHALIVICVVHIHSMHRVLYTIYIIITKHKRNHRLRL